MNPIDKKKISYSICEFGWRVFFRECQNGLLSPKIEENICFSPLGLYSFFAFSLMNSKDDEKVKQIQKILFLSNEDPKWTIASIQQFYHESGPASLEPLLISINSLWDKIDQKAILESWDEVISHQNSSENTKDAPSITFNYKPLKNDTPLFTSCSFFTPHWNIPFDLKKTSKGDFIKSNGKKIKVNYMRQTLLSNEIGFKQGEYYMALRLNCAQDIHCLILLPDRHMKIDQLLTKFSASRLQNMCVEKDRSVFDVALTLPQIHFSFQSELKDFYQSEGFTFASEPATHGKEEEDCPENTEPLHEESTGTEIPVSTLLSQTQLRVYEDSSKPIPLRQGNRPIEFKVDRPFIFVVRNSLNTILMVSKIENPGFVPLPTNDPPKSKFIQFFNELLE